MTIALDTNGSSHGHISAFQVLRIMRMARILRLFKLFRYFASLQVLARTLMVSKGQLLSMTIYILLAVRVAVGGRRVSEGPADDSPALQIVIFSTLLWIVEKGDWNAALHRCVPCPGL